MSYQAIKDLVGYALRTGLIDEYDRPWAVNELLKAMGMDAWEEPAETHERPLEDILKELLDDAAARGRIEDDTTNRDLFDTEADAPALSGHQRVPAAVSSWPEGRYGLVLPFQSGHGLHPALSHRKGCEVEGNHPLRGAGYHH